MPIRKQPGIPRGELVDYIRAAAEVLDYLYLQHSVQHLNLNPAQLWFSTTAGCRSPSSVT